MGDARQLAALLPPGQHLLNACSDRYHFAIGVAAALLSGKVCLLPPALTPEMLRRLRTFAPDVYCLSDDADLSNELPTLVFPAALEEWNCLDPVPRIDGAQQVAWIFTSGSTGAPQAHAKTWAGLVRAVRAGAVRLGLCDGRRHALVATVPAQHMFGFEVSLLMAWQSGAAFDAARPFYPEDVSAALAALPEPRTLVTTPFHLRNWLDGATHLPALENIVSATAPLSQPLALRAETLCGARVFEIYGSTETGQVASRHPAHSAEWRLYDGLRLRVAAEHFWVSGGHIECPVELQDVLEPVSAERFLLHGRSADLVNIAGKRSSLGYLNYQLTAIPGVLDGAYYMPAPVTVDGVTRLMAFVVAPGLTRAELKAALLERVDPLFVPRPLFLVSALPRNENGKLTLVALQALAASCREQAAR